LLIFAAVRRLNAGHYYSRQGAGQFACSKAMAWESWVNETVP
jgi:hypothetical protein